MELATTKSKDFCGTGRRKTAVARVRLRDGSGRILVNGRPVEEYFTIQRMCDAVKAPLAATKTLRSYDIVATIHGGGPSGQAGALVMGIGRALLSTNAEFLGTLREHKFLTRDARMTERKKYGHKKARKSFQYSKR